MISAWHLLWIVPVSAALGIVGAAYAVSYALNACDDEEE